MERNELETDDRTEFFDTITGELRLEVVDRDHEVENVTNLVRRRGALRQELPPEIERDLNEDPDKKTYCIEQIRNWIINNEEFYGRRDDSFILRYLRVCKFDVEKSKKKILRGYNIRHNHPNYYSRSEKNEKMIEELINSGFLFSMDFAGNCKEHIVFAKVSGLILKKYGVEESIFTSVTIACEIGFEDPRQQVFGAHFVIDLKGLTMEVVMQVTPAMIWRLVNILAISAPLRIKGIHMLNAPGIASKLFVILKFFLSKKLKQRVHIHKDMESFHAHISPEYIPFEYGGSAGSVKQFMDGTLEMFRNGKDVNEENQKYGINKHPDRNSNYDSDSDQDVC